MSSNGPPAFLVIKARMQTLNNDIDKLRDELTNRDETIKYEAEKRCEIEAELFQLYKKIEFVVAEKESLEIKFKDAVERLDLICHDANKSEKNRKIIENMWNADIDRIDQLEQQLKFSLISTDEANKRYEELLMKVSLSEHVLEQAETRSLTGDNHIKQLEADLKMIITKLKSLEFEQDRVSERETGYESHIRCLTMQLREADERALSVEKEASKREQEVNKIKEAMDREKNYYNYIKKELDQLHDGTFGL